MQRPIQITFRHIEQTQAIGQYVHSRASKLDAFARHTVGCRVAAEKSHAHSQHGNQYRVRIDVTVAGGEIVAEHSHEDLYAAIDAAFDVAGRRLQDFVRKRRGEVKSHEPSSEA